MVELVAAVRAAVGPGPEHPRRRPVRLRQRRTGPRRVAAALRSSGVFCLETPLWADDIAGYAELSARSPVPIAAGEWLATRHEFAELIDRGGVQVVQPDIGRVGGPSEASGRVRAGGRAGSARRPARLEDRDLARRRRPPGGRHASHALLRVPAAGAVHLAPASGAGAEELALVDGRLARPSARALGSSSTATRWREFEQAAGPGGVGRTPRRARRRYGRRARSARPGRRHPVGLVLELVGERRELDRARRLACSSASASSRSANQGLRGQERPVEVGAVDAARARALEARAAVVAEARDHARRAASRPGRGSSGRAWFSNPASRSPAQAQSIRTSPIIRRSPATRLRAASSPTPGSSAPRAVAVGAAEQLVAAADAEERRRPRAAASASAAALRGEVGGDELLVAVLAAADVEEVELADRRPRRRSRSRATSSVVAAGRARGRRGRRCCRGRRRC